MLCTMSNAKLCTDRPNERISRFLHIPPAAVINPFGVVIVEARGAYEVTTDALCQLLGQACMQGCMSGMRCRTCLLTSAAKSACEPVPRTRPVARRGGMQLKPCMQLRLQWWRLWLFVALPKVARLCRGLGY